MKKLLLLLLLSLGLIGSSWSLSLLPTDEERLDRLNNQIAYITEWIESSSEIYEMQVNVLIEKRKLLNPESNQEEIDEIIKLSYAARERCFDAFRNYWNDYEILGNTMEAIIYRPYDQAISEAKYKIEVVINRCSLSIDESCHTDLKEADENLQRAIQRRLNAEPTYYKITKSQLLENYCPDWNFLYSKSIEKINDSDS